MSLSKKGAGAWKKQNVIFFFDEEDESPDATLEFKFVSTKGLQKLRSHYDYNAKITQIYYYKEESADVTKDVDSNIFAFGAIGVAIVGFVILGPAATAAYAKAVKLGEGILGVTVSATSVFAYITRAFFAFHGFLVLGCPGGTWVSIEKNGEEVVIQVGKSRDEVVKFKEPTEPTRSQRNQRGETKLLKEFDVKREEQLTLEMFLEWVIYTKQKENEYDTRMANCKHLCADVVKDFASEPELFPWYRELLYEGFQAFINGKKGEKQE